MFGSQERGKIFLKTKSIGMAMRSPSFLGKAMEVAQQVKAGKSRDLSLIPRTHMKTKEENQLHKVALSPPHPHGGTSLVPKSYILILF